MKAWTILLPLAVVLLLLGSCCKVKPFQLFPTEDMYRILDPPPADRNYVACKANGQVCVYPPIFPGLYGQFYKVELDRNDREIYFVSNRAGKSVNSSVICIHVIIPEEYRLGDSIPMKYYSWNTRGGDTNGIEGTAFVDYLAKDYSRLTGRFSFDVERLFVDGTVDTIRVTDGVFNFKLAPNK